MVVVAIFCGFYARQPLLGCKIQAVLRIRGKSACSYDFYWLPGINPAKVAGRAAQKTAPGGYPQRPICGFMQRLNSLAGELILPGEFPESLAVIPEQAIICAYPDQAIPVLQHEFG